MRKLLIKFKRGILNLGAIVYRADITDGLILFLVFSAAWWMTAQQGGARDESVPTAMRLLLAALVLHGASLLIRPAQQARLSLAGFIFIPFVAWLSMDAAILAPDRGLAIRGLTIALLLASAWHLVLHHSRRTWSHVGCLTLLSAPAAILACGAFDSDDRYIAGLLGVMPNPAFSGHFISAMGSPGVCAAVLLLALMPPLAVALNPKLKTWVRMVAAYFASLLVIGLIATDHVWAWLGFVAGLVVMLWMICESTKVRIVIAGAVVLTGWTLASGALTRVGFFQSARNDPEQIAWLARATGAAIRNHPLVGDGAGSFPLIFETVRPATWQTDPVTCGSLPLQLICEHGLMGALILLLPVGWVIGRCLRQCLTRSTLTDKEIIASGGQRRIALRRSLAIGSTTGAIGAGFVLTMDYPCSLPGVLLLIIATSAVAFRLCQDEESNVVSERPIPVIGFTCLILPVVAASCLLAPAESAATAASARETVAQFSPAGLVSPRLLEGEAQSNLETAAQQLELACRLNPLDGELHAWHAQSLALLVRQSPRDEWLQGRARRVATQAVQLNPRSIWAHAVLGSILLGAQEPDQRARGLVHLRTAAELAPMNQSIALRLAQALGQTGASVDELRVAYERAQLTNPRRTEVSEKLVLLKTSSTKEVTPR